MITDEIRKTLYEFKDDKYRLFQGSLIPTVDMDDFIGVRTPVLRQYAKRLSEKHDLNLFLEDLPHRFFDENQLHAFIISDIKDFKKCIDNIDRFLPYVDNWATCDQMSPGIFAKHTCELQDHINKWISSEHSYTVRFGTGMLMRYFLDELFDVKYLRRVADIRSDDYYVNMMRAWFFATALAKQYESAVTFIEGRYLDTWTHNKAIRKAVESRRISKEKKAILKNHISV